MGNHSLQIAGHPSAHLLSVLSSNKLEEGPAPLHERLAAIRFPLIIPDLGGSPALHKNLPS